MPIITINDVYKNFGTEVVFSGLNLTLYRKEKVGLIGANGCGKTTLLKLINSQLELDDGSISMRKNLQIGYLPQEPQFDSERTVIEELHLGLESILTLQNKIEEISSSLAELTGNALDSAMAEYDRLNHEFEIAGGYEYEIRLHSILDGVGLGKDFYNVRTCDLSGGQKSRLGLAKVLMSKTDMLLLDEPTNHLDLAGRDWLEKFINSYNGAVVVISHDRYLLDKIACKIIEMQFGQAIVYKGNYSKFLQSSEQRYEQQINEYEKRKAEVEKAQDFIARNINDVGMSKVARGRRKQLDRLLEQNPDYLKKPVAKQKVNFDFADLDKQSYQIAHCLSLSKAYDSLVLFENLNFEMTVGQRLGVTGPNGTGKSTLLKIALGQVAADSGELRIGGNIEIGYLDQQGAELDPEKTVLEEARAVVPEMGQSKVRSKLGAFLFTGDDVFKTVSQLSGGQQNRLALCKLVMKQPQLLILDEPTNHLDIQTREVLEQALTQYKGAILVVSHDRFFLDRVVDKLLIIGVESSGKKKMNSFEIVDGNYSYYANLLEQRKAERNSQPAASASKKRKGQNNKSAKAVPQELKKFNRMTIEQIEDDIAELEEKVVHIRESFGFEENYKDPQKLGKLQSQYKDFEQELELLYRAYELKL